MSDTNEAALATPVITPQVLIPPSNLLPPKALIFGDNLVTACTALRNPYGRTQARGPSLWGFGLFSASLEKMMSKPTTHSRRMIMKTAMTSRRCYASYISSVPREHKSYTRGIVSIIEIRSPATT